MLGAPNISVTWDAKQLLIIRFFMPDLRWTIRRGRNKEIFGRNWTVKWKGLKFKVFFSGPELKELNNGCVAFLVCLRQVMRPGCSLHRDTGRTQRFKAIMDPRALAADVFSPTVKLELLVFEGRLVGFFLQIYHSKYTLTFLFVYVIRIQHYIWQTYAVQLYLLFLLALLWSYIKMRTLSFCQLALVFSKSLNSPAALSVLSHN